MAAITISEAINGSFNILKAANVETPLLEARSILCSLLKCQIAFLYAHGGDELDSGLAALFFEQIKKRSEGVPLQYITGIQEFMSLEFQVNGNVLIPRQDTEILVETMISEFSGQSRKIEILDLCTGSGCIGVSLSYYLKYSRVTALDISKEALDVAVSNARTHGLEDRIEFVQGNLFEKLTGKYDAIVSNPPYIPEADIGSLSIEVRDFEPRLALDGGKDGLDFYRKICREAPRYLVQGGVLAFEAGFGQAAFVAEFMSPLFTDIKIVKDFAGIDRVVFGRLK